MAAGAVTGVAPKPHTRIIAVAVMGVSSDRLGLALSGLTVTDPVFWRVHGGSSHVRIADVAVCPFTLCRTAARRFRTALIVAVAPGPQSFDAVARSYADGASVFVETLGTGTIAAQIVAAIRRGGLLPPPAHQPVGSRSSYLLDTLDDQTSGVLPQSKARP